MECRKLFRGTQVDIDDCLALVKYRGAAIDLKNLEGRFRETASYSISEDKIKLHKLSQKLL